ncbi:MAG: beta-ketoacyl-[acyl-carrier-protein] synthase II [Planctomycetota bacterium]|nr:MAG: beta-ketoacyl-[acyl-carrier-protein] synthase II [Planctomycetota bacterium]
MSAKERRVVVTGLGALSPLASGAEETFRRLLAGENGIKTIERWDTSRHTTKFAGEIQGVHFHPGDHFDRKELKRLDLFSQIGLVAAREAFQDSGLGEGNFDPTRAGAVLGTGIGGINSILEQHDVYKGGGPRRITPFFIPNTMANALPGNVAIEFGLQGPCFSTSSACASSGHAIGMALREIRSGEADVMLTGGAEATTNFLCVAGFNSLKALSKRNEAPDKASRPFDTERDGFVMGEGSGVLVLESLEHAQKRGAKIYCEMAGFGQTDDAGHITAPDATAKVPSRAMSKAMEDAGMNPEEVDYVNAHGTSTSLNDAMETVAIKMALGERVKDIAISSSKSMIGHLIGAASAVEGVICALSLHQQAAHATRNLEHPDVDNGCDLDYMQGAAREMPIRGVLSNSFGFGGHNVTLAFRRF